MLFKKFQKIANKIILLNQYYSILKQKNIIKKNNNNNFYHPNNFFWIIIKARIVTLYIYIANYSIIDKLQIQIGRSYQLSIIL